MRVGSGSFFAVIAVCAAQLFASPMQDRVFGPQMQWGAHAEGGPKPKGPWMPQADLSFHFDWLEPLDDIPYNQHLKEYDRYLRFGAQAELSPLYGLVGASIGAAPIPFRHLQVELRLLYHNLFYFDSNVEMPLVDGGARIQNTWDSDYIFDHLHNRSYFGQIQNFGFRMEMFSDLGWMYFDLFCQFSMVDVKSRFFGSQFSGKSFDYHYNIPVASRDHLWQVRGRSQFPLGKIWGLDLQFDFYRTAKTVRSNDPELYDKEPLGYIKFLLGPKWNWTLDGIYSSLMVRPGYWYRFKDNGSFHNGWENLLLELRYVYSWHL
jgi:hypothetical protein